MSVENRLKNVLTKLDDLTVFFSRVTVELRREIVECQELSKSSTQEPGTSSGDAARERRRRRGINASLAMEEEEGFDDEHVGRHRRSVHRIRSEEHTRRHSRETAHSSRPSTSASSRLSPRDNEESGNERALEEDRERQTRAARITPVRPGIPSFAEFASLLSRLRSERRQRSPREEEVSPSGSSRSSQSGSPRRRNREEEESEDRERSATEPRDAGASQLTTNDVEPMEYDAVESRIHAENRSQETPERERRSPSIGLSRPETPEPEERDPGMSEDDSVYPDGENEASESTSAQTAPFDRSVHSLKKSNEAEGMRSEEVVPTPNIESRDATIDHSEIPRRPEAPTVPSRPTDVRQRESLAAKIAATRPVTLSASGRYMGLRPTEVVHLRIGEMGLDAFKANLPDISSDEDADQSDRSSESSEPSPDPSVVLLPSTSCSGRGVQVKAEVGPRDPMFDEEDEEADLRLGVSIPLRKGSAGIARKRRTTQTEAEANEQSTSSPSKNPKAPQRRRPLASSDGPQEKSIDSTPSTVERPQMTRDDRRRARIAENVRRENDPDGLLHFMLTEKKEKTISEKNSTNKERRAVESAPVRAMSKDTEVRKDGPNARAHSPDLLPRSSQSVLVDRSADSLARSREPSEQAGCATPAIEPIDGCATENYVHEVAQSEPPSEPPTECAPPVEPIAVDAPITDSREQSGPTTECAPPVEPIAVDPSAEELHALDDSRDHAECANTLAAFSARKREMHGLEVSDGELEAQTPGPVKQTRKRKSHTNWTRRSKSRKVEAVGTASPNPTTPVETDSPTPTTPAKKRGRPKKVVPAPIVEDVQEATEEGGSVNDAINPRTARAVKQLRIDAKNTEPKTKTRQKVYRRNFNTQRRRGTNVEPARDDVECEFERPEEEDDGEQDRTEELLRKVLGPSTGEGVDQPASSASHPMIKQEPIEEDVEDSAKGHARHVERRRAGAARRRAHAVAIKTEPVDPNDECRITASHLSNIKREPGSEDVAIFGESINPASFGVETRDEPETPLVKDLSLLDCVPYHTRILVQPYWRSINYVFRTDTAKFCDLMMVLHRDTASKGRALNVNVAIDDFTSRIPEEYVDFLAALPRVHSFDHTRNSFTANLRKNVGTVLDGHHLSIDQLYGVVDLIRGNLEYNTFSHGTKLPKLMKEARDILRKQYIESIEKAVSMQPLGSTTSATQRRVEMVFYGFKQFLMQGGFFRLVLALGAKKAGSSGHTELDDVHNSEVRSVIHQMEENYNFFGEMVKFGPEKTIEVLMPLLVDDVERINLAELAADATPTGEKKRKCITCSQLNVADGLNVFFSNDHFLAEHGVIHESRAQSCVLCNYELTCSIGQLKLHQMVAHSNLPTTSFPD